MEKVVPKGWMTIQLKDACYIYDNRRIPLNSSERSKRKGSVPYYGATGAIDMVDDYIFDEELLLIGEDGAPFFDKKKDVAYLIRGKSWVNNHAHVLKAKDQITLNKYVYYYLNHFDYNGYVGGATRLKLTPKSLEEIPIDIPPYELQKDIVKRLDEIFAISSRISERFQKVSAIRESLLNSFILDETSTKHPLIPLRELIVEKGKRIGQAWEEIRLVGVDSNKGIINLRSSSKSNYPNYKIVQPGDFVYNPMRINIGSIAIYDGIENALTSPDYVVFGIKQTLTPLLLLDYLKSPFGQNEIARHTQGSVRSRLYFKSLSAITIPLSDNYTSKAGDNAYTIIEKIEQKIPFLEQFLYEFKISILQKAFCGELVGGKLYDRNTELELLKILEVNKISSKSPQIYRKPKYIKNMAIYKNLAEALKEHGGKLTAKELWETSSYKHDIDEFYANLKAEIEDNKTISESEDKQYLILNEN